MKTRTKLTLAAGLAIVLVVLAIASSTGPAPSASAQGAPAGQSAGYWQSGPWYQRMVYGMGSTMQHWMGEVEMLGRSMMGWMGGRAAGCGPAAGMGHSGTLDCSRRGMPGR